jgi:hypothetical protein
MKSRIILRSLIVLFVILAGLNCMNKKKDVSSFKNECEKKLDYFYKSIILKQRYDLLDKFLLNNIAMMDSNNYSLVVWDIEGKEEIIDNIKQKQIKYGTFLKYKVMDARYFYAHDHLTHNTYFKVRVLYEEAKTDEVVILGYKDNSDEQVKLIGYSSKIILNNNKQ